MTLTTRRSVLAAVGACLSTAGCISDTDGTDPEESTTSERPSGTTTRSTTEKTTTATTDGTTTGDDPETTGDWIEQASNEPDPNLPIYLNNEAAEARTVRVWVVREQTGETVFDETREVSVGAEIAAYNLKHADPEGVEAFRVCGALVDSDEETVTTSETTANETTASETTASETTEESDTRGCQTLRTNECYGTGHVTVEEDGSLTVFYSIC